MQSVTEADNNQSKGIVPRSIIIPFVLLSTCFMMWGVANNMTDPLVRAFTDIFTDMSTFQASLIQLAFYGAYFCLAIPGAIITRKFDKCGVLTGLGLYIIGGLLFFPASMTKEYVHFLIAFYVLAGGLSILETSANPYVLAMGPEETATQRLNLAQSFNPIGSIIGTIITQYAILAKLEAIRVEKVAGLSAEALDAIQSKELSVVMIPYFIAALALIILWSLIAVRKMPHAIEHDQKTHFFETVAGLLSNANYVFAVVAQFFYVGAQITVWTFTVHYIGGQLDIQPSEALRYHTVALMLFGLGRFICTGLMSIIKPSVLLFIIALASISLTSTVILGGGTIGVYALIGVSACMSLMFPTIFGLGTRGLGEATKIGASGLIMAILGGALLTPLQGKLIDIFS